MSTLDEFYSGGPRTWNEAFPPVCLRTHWDPTAVTKHVLPTTGPTQLPLDPRQATKICYGYYHTSFGDPKSTKYSNDESAHIPTALLGNKWVSPQIGTSSVFPPGGAASRGFPYGKYAPSAESDLQVLHYPLTRCAERKYLPPNRQVPITDSTNDVPGADTSTLSPLATKVSFQAGCRNEDDQTAWNRSSRLFFNPTKYDRTQGVPSGIYSPESKSSLLCK